MAAPEEDLKKWTQAHEKKDAEAFAAVHTHLDRLDKATNNDLILYKIDELFLKIAELDKKIDHNYVTRKEFEPVRNIVYGLVALLLSGLIVAIVRVVIK